MKGDMMKVNLRANVKWGPNVHTVVFSDLILPITYDSLYKRARIWLDKNEFLSLNDNNFVVEVDIINIQPTPDLIIQNIHANPSDAIIRQLDLLQDIVLDENEKNDFIDNNLAEVTLGKLLILERELTNYFFNRDTPTPLSMSITTNNATFEIETSANERIEIDSEVVNDPLVIAATRILFTYLQFK